MGKQMDHGGKHGGQNSNEVSFSLKADGGRKHPAVRPRASAVCAPYHPRAERVLRPPPAVLSLYYTRRLNSLFSTLFF